MKYHVVAAACVALIASVTLSFPANSKTAKVCEAEWKANKPAIQARGTKKKDFIATCRAEGEAAAPTPSRVRTERKSAPAPTAKACEERWKANKPAIQASGKRKKDFISECRSGVATISAPAKQDERSAPTPRTNSRETSAPPTSAPARRETSTPAASKPTGENQFSTETAAKIRCPLDTIVWVNTKSGIYHYSGHKDYGATKMGAYMCEKDTPASGYRAARNETRPK